MIKASFSRDPTSLVLIRGGLYDETVAADNLLNSKLVTSIPNRFPRRLFKPFVILLLTVAGFAVMGYHPGFEDDGIYLSAVKADLDPSLYPHDADFFRLQLQATVFDRFISGFVRVTRVSLPWAELLWQLASLYTILWAAHGIAQKLFPEKCAQWAGAALLAALFTLPVAGTALYIADQHLHPRNMATALILLAVERLLAGRKIQAVAFLAPSMLLHPIMGAFGISFCCFLVVGDRLYRCLTRHGHPAAAFPLIWVFEPPTPAWRRALDTRTYYFLGRWTWYEWLGAFGPLVLFWLLRLYALRRRETLLARFALALIIFGAFQQAIAIVLLAPPLIRLTPLQPMRYLHLEYIFLVLIAGCLLGRHLLSRVAWRWALCLVTVGGGMFLSQRLLLPASPHLELPGMAPGNGWLQAFAWIRENTPPDAYFALDPVYVALPGDDHHSFRALAERSQLADAIKDAAVVTQVPELAPRWAAQVDAQLDSPTHWNGFDIARFEHLKSRFGIDWVLVPNPPPPRLTCLWHNDMLAVCRIRDSAHTPRY